MLLLRRKVTQNKLVYLVNQKPFSCLICFGWYVPNENVLLIRKLPQRRVTIKSILSDEKKIHSLPILARFSVQGNIDLFMFALLL